MNVTKTGKWMEGKRRKKTTIPAKRGLAKKRFFGKNGPRGNRPMTPTKKALRAALWTTSTSGKALHDGLLTPLPLYRNIVITRACVNNKTIILLIELLYCYSSTAPEYALIPVLSPEEKIYLTYQILPSTVS